MQPRRSSGDLHQTDARDMAGWDHGEDFSPDASVRIDGVDRAPVQIIGPIPLRFCAPYPLAARKTKR
jgi:hypothetical protein